MKNKNVKVTEDVAGKGNNRRRFLKMSGLAIAGSGLLLSCSDDDDFTPGGGGDDDDDDDDNGMVFDLGSGDLGVLNYAYALEQLEAEFYTRVVNGGYYSGASMEEKTLFEDLYKHEVNHREFFKAALNANFDEDVVLPAKLEFNLDIDFGSRDKVLQTAMTLEDTGVAAYNGAGKIIKTADYLVLAGKIVSVEARHAAAIRSIIGGDMDDYAYFAADGVVDPETGLDQALSPSEVIDAAGAFFATEFTYKSEGVG